MSWYEKEARKALEAEGYTVIKGGEPDFWLVKDGKIVGWREVKSPYDTVKPHQQVMHELLLASGIPGEVVTFTFGRDSSKILPSEPLDPVSPLAKARLRLQAASNQSRQP